MDTLRFACKDKKEVDRSDLPFFPCHKELPV